MALFALLMAAISFFVCYGGANWFSSTAKNQPINLSDTPAGELSLGKRDIDSPDVDYFVKLFATKKVVVVRSWIKFPYDLAILGQEISINVRYFLIGGKADA